MRNGWGMDDIFVLRDNEQVMRGVSGIPEIFATPYYSGPGATFGYRPLTKAMFAAEYSVFGINLPVHHSINVLLYFVCGLLVFRFLRRYFEQQSGMLFVWLAFLVWFLHPAHTEVVASLKNREEMLWMIFGFLSLEQMEKYIERSKTLYLLLALVLFGISYLAKQSALSLVLVIPLLMWYRYGGSSRKILSGKQILAVVVFIVIVLSGWVLYKVTYRLFSSDQMEIFYFENPLRYQESFIIRVATGFTTLLYYLKILIFPHPLLFYYGLYTVPEWSLLSAPVILSAMLHLIFLAAVIYGVRKKTSLAFGLGFYLLTLFMFSNFPENVNGIVAERLAFVPSIGFSVAMVAVLFYLFSISREVKIRLLPVSLKVILVVLFVFYSGKTIVRNTSWRDSKTLFASDIRYAYRSVQANSILAGEMMDRVIGELNKGAVPQRYKSTVDSVLFLYNRVWQLYPENYRVLNNMGDLYMTFRNQPDTALAYLACAFRLEPENFFVNYNIARGFEMKGNDRYALFYYSRAGRINPEKKQAEEKIKTLKKKNAETDQ
jgi:hypothetical protein